MKKTLLLLLSLTLAAAVCGQPRRRHNGPYETTTPMVHDPVMAFEDGTYHLLSTGHGLQWATSRDRRTWTVQARPFMTHIPEWTHDSVPGFRNHVWAPDIVRHNGRWWLAYSCSTFGKNTSAIGLMSSDSLTGQWKDEGCLVASKEKRDNWNAIDPCFVADGDGRMWLAWGSFWDGIQLAMLDSCMHLATTPVTIARRYDPKATDVPDNPTSKFAGRNAIEAPFILHHGDYFYLFVSWDYCCRGAKSNYRVAVGRSQAVSGPYLDRSGKPMLEGGGTLFFEGDRVSYEAAGHCAAYHFGNDDIFICHGYSVEKDGASLLVDRTIRWTSDGWPQL